MPNERLECWVCYSVTKDGREPVLNWQRAGYANEKNVLSAIRTNHRKAKVIEGPDFKAVWDRRCGCFWIYQKVILTVPSIKRA